MKFHFRLLSAMVDFSIRRPKTVMVLVLIAFAAAASQLPRIVIDTDPENMLSEDQAARVFHDQTKKDFTLHDMLVVGVVNDTDPNGIYNPHTLGRVHELTRAIQAMDGVIPHDLMSLASIDNISQGGPGVVRFAWMMHEPPQTEEEVLAIRDAARRLPIVVGTIVSEDEKAAGIYVPIVSKDESHRLATEIEEIVAGMEGDEKFFVTGLPVAEDTFGVEMFKQMGMAAPLAGLIIMILMWIFFRSFVLVLSPMILAMVTVTITMGLLIGFGFPVHIMSSMIPIFLMPIAVVDSVHILSEFADMYPKIKDKRKTIRLVMNDLLQPMHFTSLTSAAGFLSLLLAPIPPVRVFGFFVAFGITLAFYLTILFIPAYVVRLSDARIAKLRREEGHNQHLLARILGALGPWAVGRAKLVAALTVIVMVISAIGISKIEINDNPVRWFRTSHKIRVADRVLNEHFGGTYNAFFVMEKPSTTDERDAFLREADKLLADVKENEGVDLTTRWKDIYRSSQNTPGDGYFDVLIDAAMMELDEAPTDAEIYAWEDLIALVEDAQTRAKFFQSPEALDYVAGLQTAMVADEMVGKTMSLTDIVKTVHRELREGDEAYFTVPGTSNAVAQTLLSYQSSHRPQDLWHFATPDYRKTQIWLQLASGDNRDMAHVTEEVDRYIAAHPLPEGVTFDWAGLTYLNVVWQDAMVSGMRDALIGSFAIVFIMMLVLFRSFWFGLLAMLPLSVTIAFIYGVIGLAGKDYDMPVAVLSSLTLGLSVDFAIHFLQRARQVYRNTGDWTETVREMFAEPARAISRNAIVIAVGFLPLLASPLMPYNTVGLFLATIMAVSCGVTLVLLPGMMTFLKRRLFPEPGAQEPGVEASAAETQQDVASGGQAAPVGNTPNANLELGGGATMKAMIPLVFAGALALFAMANPAQAEDLTDVDVIIDRANVAAYYAGNDGRSEVRMTITDAQGRERRRQFMILRKDVVDGGDQNYAVLFVRPADVRNSVFIVHKHVGKDDDRWLYLPDLDLVKRIAAGDKRTSFVGSDFFYEDVSGRASGEDTHELIETTDTHYVLKNTPKDPGSVEFKHWTAWIDKKTMIPTKMEYVDAKGEVYRMIEALEVKDFQGHPTVTKMKVTDVRGGGYTISEFRNVEYDLGIPDEVFTERTLRSPSREWFRPKKP